ncbi:MAG: antibiotic biosynthesis monooxygenase [Calothrix sp. FI2-JRJ7]|jgi:heme-degrading monooxygenase HmoA|nr:antibiotic biosynthesis monooxygenase [Calothrix sp. FI2-JRJ7]
MASSVVLINVFTVPQGKEDEFIKIWNETGQFLKNASGFIDAKLHRSLDANARFQFINVAHWESVEAYEAAISEHQPKEKQVAWLEANPALYTVEAQY